MSHDGSRSSRAALPQAPHRSQRPRGPALTGRRHLLPRSDEGGQGGEATAAGELMQGGTYHLIK
eukprot:scaffold3223_cov50-Phaeocystis_antarctica.AAC.1